MTSIRKAKKQGKLVKTEQTAPVKEAQQKSGAATTTNAGTAASSDHTLIDLNINRVKPLIPSSVRDFSQHIPFYKELTEGFNNHVLPERYPQLVQHINEELQIRNPAELYAFMKVFNEVVGQDQGCYKNVSGHHRPGQSEMSLRAQFSEPVPGFSVLIGGAYNITGQEVHICDKCMRLWVDGEYEDRPGYW